MRTDLAVVSLVVAGSVLGARGRVAVARERGDAGPDDPDAVAESLFRLAEADEDAGDFARAMEHDRASLAAAPGSEWARRAADRIEWLRSRSEGDFAPLARLERVRRDPVRAADPAAIDALAVDARSFPPGQVRVEAEWVVARSWLDRGRVDDAIAELRQVTVDPEADPHTARRAAREIVDALAGEGRLDDAAAEARARADRLDPRFVTQTERLVRRRTMHRAALVELGVFVGVAGVALVRARLEGTLAGAARAVRAVAPLALGFAAYLAGAGGGLASQYEAGRAAPFVLLGLGVLPLVLLARAWAAVGSTRAPARIGRAVLCAASVLATAFVILDVTHPAYLEGFGL